MKFTDFIDSCKADSDDIALKCSYAISGNADFEIDWKKEHADWANYVANMSLKSIEKENEYTVINWCKNNLVGRFDVCVPIYFELEEDLVLFLIRWG